MIQHLLSEPESPQGVSWYYLQVKQVCGNFAWSSPVWGRAK